MKDDGKEEIGGTVLRKEASEGMAFFDGKTGTPMKEPTSASSSVLAQTANGRSPGEI